MNTVVQIPRKLKHPLIRETAAQFLLFMDIAVFFFFLSSSRLLEGELLLTFFSPIHIL